MRRLKKVNVQGYRLAYRQAGAGEPLLLVHGITTYSFIWRRMLPDLAADFKVLAVDLLGCGASDKPLKADYSISAQADLLTEFIEKLNLGPVHLVGHDVGGGIAQILAVRRPDLLKTMILINPVAYDYWPVLPITGLRIPILRIIGMALLEHGFLKVMVKQGMYHKDQVDDELMSLFQAPLKSREGRHGFLRLAHSLDNRDLLRIAAEISQIKIPTLLIRGSQDPYLEAEAIIKLHREISGSQLIIVPEGGHYIQEDEPLLLVKYIRDFIRESGYGQRPRDKAA